MKRPVVRGVPVRYRNVTLVAALRCAADRFASQGHEACAALFLDAARELAEGDVR